MTLQMQKEIGPNWFASVMGTGIIANAAVGLPIIGNQLTLGATIVWLLASFFLVILCCTKCWQTITKPHIIRRQLNDPVMAQFFGAPPMALLTVAGGTLLFGHQFMPNNIMLILAWSLWIVGTLTGLLSAVFIPYRLFTRLVVRDDGAFGGWLMPVVPPMVSAAIGAMFIPHIKDVAMQQTFLYLCYAMFGMSLMAGFIIITLIWSRLAHAGTSGSARVPTLWIVLGPLGQSITAAGALGAVALLVLDNGIAQAFNAMALVYGMPVWGFALLWSWVATLLTISALKKKMPFALTWWAFTFPIGTCVTGTSQLALHTQLVFFEYAAILLFVVLIVAWFVAAIGTAKGLKHGTLLLIPLESTPIISKKDQ